MLWVLHIVEVKHEVRQINLKTSCGSAGKESAWGRPWFDPWVGKIPWRREQLPTPVFWPGEFHGLHSPWGHKELNTTNFHFHFPSFMVLGLEQPETAQGWPRHPHPCTSLFLSSHIFYTWLALGFFRDGNFRIVGILTWWAQDSTSYCSSRQEVEALHGTTDWFKTGKGVHQGYILTVYVTLLLKLICRVHHAKC